MKKTKECVFCGDSPTNVEDVWPKWIGRYLGRQPTHRYERTSSSGVARTFRSFSVTDRAKVVCKDTCNGGWMKGLEDEVNPVMKRMFDERVTFRLIAGPTQLALARWALKTAMMIQYTQKASSIPPEVYHDFFWSARAIPRHCVIFLARHRMEQIPNGSHSIDWRFASTRDPRPGVDYQGQLYGVTFYVQNVVMQVVGYRFAAETDFGLDLRFPKRFAPYVQRLWPMGTGIEWPPPPQQPTLDDRLLIQFTQALTEIVFATEPGTGPPPPDSHP